MKRTRTLTMAAMFIAALCISSCDHNNGEGGNGGGGNHEYPATANVIRNAVKDIDGNKYDAVRIGDQVWMAENLKTTRYADGTTIPLATEEEYEYDRPSRFYPNESEHTVKNYGYLYNWTATMHGESHSSTNPSGVQGICPNGWHVPSFAEWNQLWTYMESEPMYMASGNSNHIAKALAATWGWTSCSYKDTPGNDPSTNNASGFSAVPAGCGGNEDYCFGKYANFNITNGEGNVVSIFYDYPYVMYDKKKSIEVYSVRCVKD